MIKRPLIDPETSWEATPVAELPSWPEHGRIAIDTESREPTDFVKNGVDFWRGGNVSRVVGVSFAIEDVGAWYLPVGHEAGGNLDPALVWAYLREQAAQFEGTLVGANLPHDLDHLAREGVTFLRTGWFKDVQVADPIIYELHGDYSLDAILRRWGVPPKDEGQLDAAARAWGFSKAKGGVKGNLWRLPAGHVGPYATQDVVGPLVALRRQEREIEIKDLWRVWEMECRVLPILLKMKQRGVLIDQDALAANEARSLAQVREHLKIVEQHTSHVIDPDDLGQKAALLPALEKIGYGQAKLSLTEGGAKRRAAGREIRPVDYEITAEVLKLIEHPVADAILAAKKADKLRSTFCASIRRFLGDDGRVHTTFNQLKRQTDASSDLDGTITGRLSSKQPNLQQQPRRGDLGKQWRRVYVPEPGMIWGKLDYCYSQDTEILTEQGWKLFPDLRAEDRVAQWDDGVINYVEPSERIVGESPGEMIHIRGDRQVDLLVTPNHDCILRDFTGRPIRVKAPDYENHPGWLQPQSGVLFGTGQENPSLLQLVAAVQADAADRETSFRFWLSREDKIERLLSILHDLGVPFMQGQCASKGNQTYITIPALDELRHYLMWGKTFHRAHLIALAEDKRQLFLEELLFWDGDRKGRRYLSTNLVNCETVQELAVLTGYRSNSWVRKSDGRKPLGVVSLSRREGTYAKTLTQSRIEYSGPVYCVTVPSGAILVRRNGRVTVSGNSSQEPRIMVHAGVAQGLRGAAEFAERYATDPMTDFHQMVTDMALAAGAPLKPEEARDKCKIAGLARAYGAGLGKLAMQLDLPYAEETQPDGRVFLVPVGPETQQIVDAIDRAVPFLAELQRLAKQAGARNGYIVTAGGRRLHFPMKGSGNGYDFLHKAFNKYVQGTAADQTKLGMIAADAAGHYLQLQVHDELDGSFPDDAAARACADLMETCLELKCVSRCDPEIGPSWGETK